MLLAIDIGNSSIKLGVFDGEQLLSKFSIPTKRDSTPGELKTAIGRNLDLPISNVIVCSVVPEVERSLSVYLHGSFGVEPFFVRNDFDFGLKINYEPLSAAGTDRLVNAFAAAEKYGVPCIVCSFGTATTIDVVNANREFLGGVIAPGMATMSKALYLNTSKLPEIEIERPDHVIGDTTVSSIQSGIFYGYLGLVEGIIARITSELDEKPTVVATGGFAPTIWQETDLIDVIDEQLLLEGLRLLCNRFNA